MLAFVPDQQFSIHAYGLTSSISRSEQTIAMSFLNAMFGLNCALQDVCQDEQQAIMLSK